jgi:hypothetical protein
MVHDFYSPHQREQLLDPLLAQRISEISRGSSYRSFKVGVEINLLIGRGKLNIKKNWRG